MERGSRERGEERRARIIQIDVEAARDGLRRRGMQISPDTVTLLAVSS